MSPVILRHFMNIRPVITKGGIAELFQLQPGCRLLSVSSRLQEVFKIQDEEDFNKKVLKSKKPVVVQFMASWCGPCKQLAPRMEKSIAAIKNAVDLAQIDIDDNPDIAMSYSVGAVPAVLAIKNGKVVDKFIGLKDEDQVDSFVKKLAKC